MFKSLKEKLKGWISRTKEETEEKPVETPKEPKEDKTEKKVEKKPEEKIDKKPEKKEKPVEKEKKVEKKEEIKEKPKEEKAIKEKPVIEKKKEESKKEIEEIKEEAVEEKKVEKEKPEEKTEDTSKKEEKSGFFGLFKKKKEEAPQEEPKEEIEEKVIEEEKKEEGKEEPIKEVEEKKVEAKEETKEEPPKKKSGFSLFRRKTLSEEKFEELFDELEMILLQNNVALSAIENIKSSLKEKLIGESDMDIESALKESIEELLINPPNLIEQIKEKSEKPFVILFAGINGAGKTTTIAKMTYLLKKNNFSVCLASADTFRAAAIEQLQVHADRLEVPLIKKDYGADPASVGYDAIKYAKKNNIDCVLIDTAGRMNNRDTLMKEIEKISRVNNPDLKIFLGESITGNDATEQAKDFNDAISIDGIILSKADVDEKGGTAISVAQVTNKPIYYLGMGQSYDDLEIFDKEKLIEKIFS